MDKRNPSGERQVRQINRILASDDKCTGDIKNTRGVLSLLFRAMLRDRNIKGSVWGKLMFDYLTNPANGIPDNTRDRTSMRGNLNKEFSRNEMTLKVFIKSLRFQKIARFKLIIEVEDEEGKTSKHETGTIVLSHNRKPVNEE